MANRAWYTKADLTGFVDELRRTVEEARQNFDRFDWAMEMVRVYPSNEIVLPINTYAQVQTIEDGSVPDFQKPGAFKKILANPQEYALGLGITRQMIEDAEGWDPLASSATMALGSIKKKKTDLIVGELWNVSKLGDFHAFEYGYFAEDANHDHVTYTGATTTAIALGDIDGSIETINQHGGTADILLVNGGSIANLLELFQDTLTFTPGSEAVMEGKNVFSRYNIRGLSVIEQSAVPPGYYIILDSSQKPVAGRIKRDITLDTPPDEYGLTKSYYSMRLDFVLAYPEAVALVIETAAP